MKFNLPDPVTAQLGRRSDTRAATRAGRSKTGQRVAATTLALTLLLGGISVANDDDDDDRGRGQGNAAQLRQFIDRQVGGIQKLMVPANDAAIPVPFDPARPDRYKTTPEKRFLGKMLFHDPVRTARVNINTG